MEMTQLIIGGGLLLAAGAIILGGLKTVRPNERGLVEKFGKYNRMAEPGLNFVIPIVEQMRTVELYEEMVDAEKQEIITKDNLNAVVDAQVYFKVKSTENDIKASQYAVSDYRRMIVSLARTTLRNIIGGMELKEANSDRNRINKDLFDALKIETGNWGIDIVRAELKEIQPPNKVQDAMNQIVVASSQKTAAVDFATAFETEASGKKKAAIQEAQGKAEAVRLAAEAQAKAIETINTAAEQYFVGNAQELKRLEVMQVALQNNSKIIISEKGISPNLILGDLFENRGRKEVGSDGGQMQ